LVAVLVGVVACGAAQAEVVGKSVAAESLTRERVRALPVAERKVWEEYLRRSEAQMAADKAALAKERVGMTELPPLPAQGNSAHALPLDKEVAWYRSAEAKRLGEIVLSFQTPAGGWSKNLKMTGPRLRGQAYATANLAPTPLSEGDFDKAKDETWHYVGTFDNDATNTELHYLLLLSDALPGAEGDKYRESFVRGVQYELAAQMPNGGWPQVWPLEGGYHDAVTFNDDAVTENAELLDEVATGKDFAFVPKAIRARAAEAVTRANACILRTQIRVGGVLTVWAQQYDPLTLEPVAARNFEPAALSAGESAAVVLYLMSLPKPSPAVVVAVDAAVKWMQANVVRGFAWRGGRETPGGRRLVPDPDGELWPRYVSLTTGKAIFGDRDKSIHSDVMEISLERRNGYGWYGDGPAKVLKAYPEWEKKQRQVAETTDNRQRDK